MVKGWTSERRTRQAQLIKIWQPWKSSTDPKSEAGKAAASRNSDRGLEWSALRILGTLLKTQRKLSIQTLDKMINNFGG